jgi:hypothetical protein
MDGTGDHIKWNQPDWERQISDVLSISGIETFKKRMTGVENGDCLGDETSSGERWKERVKGEYIWSKYFIHIYENRTMKTVRKCFNIGKEE